MSHASLNCVCDWVWVELWSDLSRIGVHESFEAACAEMYAELGLRSGIVSTSSYTPADDGVVKFRVLCDQGLQILILKMYLGDSIHNFL